jgi:hypothetical protein
MGNLDNNTKLMYIRQIYSETEDWSPSTWKSFRNVYGYEFDKNRPDIRLNQIRKWDRI